MTIQPMTVAQALEAFELAKGSEDVTEGTLRNYRWTLGLWANRWPGLMLGEIEPNHIRRFLLWLRGKDDEQPTDKTISGATAHIHFRNIRAFLRWCIADGLISTDPLRNVKPPQVEEKIPDVLREHEAADLLRTVKGNDDRHAFRDYVIQFFFLQTGLRLAEMAALNLNDVHLRDGFVRVTKGKWRKQRLAPMGSLLPVEVKRYILKHRDAKLGETALFVNDYGERLQARGIQALVNRDIDRFVPRKLEKDGPHTYRHTACTFMLRQGMEIKRVSIVMGHSSVAVTERYTHLVWDDIINGQKPKSLEELLAGRRRRTPQAQSMNAELEGLVRA